MKKVPLTLSFDYPSVSLTRRFPRTGKDPRDSSIKELGCVYCPVSLRLTLVFTYLLLRTKKIE